MWTSPFKTKIYFSHNFFTALADAITPTSRQEDRKQEITWIATISIGICVAAAIIVPLVFNPWGSSPFELPKAALLRGLILLAGMVMLAKVIKKGQSFRQFPLLWPAMGFGLALILATIFSSNRHLSLWGTYERQQGLLTLLPFVGLFLFTAITLQTHTRIKLLWHSLIWGSAPIVIYALLQAAHLDPVNWQSDAASPILSTLGRANFVGTYLVLVIPLTLGQLLLTTGRWPYYVLMTGQITGLALTQARSAWIGFAAAMLVFTIIRATVQKNRRLLTATLLLTGAIVSLVVLLNVAPAMPPAQLPGLNRLSHLSDTTTGSTAARITIWRTTLPLVAERPWFGYGPETMQSAFAPVFPPQLIYYQGRNLAVDRAHNLWLDLAMSAGIAGVVTFGWLLVGFGRLAWRGIRQTTNRRATTMWIALAAAITGHLVDLQFSFTTTASATIFWLILALATGLDQVEQKNSNPPPLITHRQAHNRQRSNQSFLPYLLPAVLLLIMAGFICVRPLLADIAFMKSQNNQLPFAARHAAAQQAVWLWPLEAHYRFGLAALEGNTGNFTEIDRQFVAAIKTAPHNPWLWATWGALYAHLGKVDPQQYSKAEGAFRQALALAPNVAAFHTELGRVLAEQGQFSAALTELESAIDLDTTDVTAYNHLANLYTMLNRPSDAAEAQRLARYWANKTSQTK